jgi:integrase
MDFLMPDQIRQRRKRRQTLTDGMVAALPRRPKRYVLPDPEQRGMYVRVMANGPHVYAAVARDPYGKQVWATLGKADVLDIENARDKARGAIGRIREGKPAFEPPPVKAASYRATAEKWLEVYVAGAGLRSRPEIERLLKRHVYPFWGKRDFVGIGREEINDLLDNLVKSRGAWTADHVLSIIRKIANWHATRSSTYRSPFVVGMRRTPKEARVRSRVLNDEELRRVWHTAEGGGSFGALVRTLLLTAQRRSAVAQMKWSDLKPGGVWDIPLEARAKGNAGSLKLPEAALKIIKAQPKFNKNKHVFAAARGDGPLNGFNKRKAAFDHVCGVTDWTLHDLRRTSRSMMSRAGVSSEHAERVLGHAIPGVEGVYDRHHYAEEKADALRRLAALIDRVVNPLSDNVVLLHEVAAS